MNDRNKSLAASIGLIIGCVIWGASFYQMKDAMAYIQPLPFVAVRMFGDRKSTRLNSSHRL